MSTAKQAAFVIAVLLLGAALSFAVPHLLGLLDALGDLDCYRRCFTGRFP